MANVYTFLATAAVVCLQFILSKEQDCKNSKEIVIALDAPASVGKFFYEEMTFVHELLEQLRSETNAKFTLLTYNNTVSFGNSLTVNQLIEVLMAYRLSGGETRTDLVLETLFTYLRDIPATTFGVAVILTDGYIDDELLTHVTAADLPNLKKAKVFSVNVANKEMQLLGSNISLASVSDAAKLKNLLLADCKEHCLDKAGIHTTKKVNCVRTAGCGIDYDSYGPNCYDPIVIKKANCSSSHDSTTDCNNIIDGRLFEEDINQNNCWSSRYNEAASHVVVDLGNEYIVRSVRIYGRDDEFHDQTGDFTILVGKFDGASNNRSSTCGSYNGTFSIGQQFTAYCRARGNQVKVQHNGLYAHFAICEIKVNGFPIVA